MTLVPGSSRGASGGGASALVSTTLAVAAPTITCSGIPATQTNLLVVGAGLLSTVAANTDTCVIVFNSDTTAAHYGTGPSGTSITGGFNNGIKWQMPGSSINSPGGFIMFITCYQATVSGTQQVAFTILTTGRVGLAGTSADFSQGSSNGMWTGGAAVNSISLSVATGPNYQAGGSLVVYGLA